jgi:hypothetical protein
MQQAIGGRADGGHSGRVRIEVLVVVVVFGQTAQTHIKVDGIPRHAAENGGRREVGRSAFYKPCGRPANAKLDRGCDTRLVVQAILQCNKTKKNSREHIQKNTKTDSILQIASEQ